MQLYQPLGFLGMVYMTIKQGLVDMEQMFRLLEVDRDIADRPRAATLAAHGPAGEVRFEDVQFGYRPDRADPEGRGLHRPRRPQAGDRRTDRRRQVHHQPAAVPLLRRDRRDASASTGSDIRDVTQESLRAAIGVVPQDTVLFNDTIRYNIGYGRVGATQDEIEHAARLAQVHDFIVSLPEGYDTRVGERGLKLSGGEKQRVAIARTILKDPRILILDEATSALDTRTEQDIQAALRAVARDRTTLVIAHRLSTVVDADEIIVLADGRVAERGRHAALLARDGLYARMWALQAEQEAEPEISRLRRRGR